MNARDIYNKFKQEGLIRDTELFHDSETYLDLLFSSPLNFDESAFENKINVFCPYFLEYTSLMKNPSVAEWLSGIGTFLKIFKKINQTSKLFYVNDQVNSLMLAKEIMSEYECVFTKTNTEDKFDIVFSDGVLNLFDDETIKNLTIEIINSLNVNGVLMLLLNLDPNNLRKDFNLIWIHNLIQESNMMCVWGKYTFSSMWIKKQNN